MLYVCPVSARVLPACFCSGSVNKCYNMRAWILVLPCFVLFATLRGQHGYGDDEMKLCQTCVAAWSYVRAVVRLTMFCLQYMGGGLEDKCAWRARLLFHVGMMPCWACLAALNCLQDVLLVVV